MSLVRHANLISVREWFSDRGGTDLDYLNAGFPRFEQTLDFAKSTLADGAVILDVGAHWLHQSFLFANAGYKLKCLDAAITMSDEHVKSQAAAMGAEVFVTNRLEVGDGINLIENDSVDAIIFTEIIEHLTFNPIPMWKELYRVLRPGGHIYISTPNSMYHENLQNALLQMETQHRYGIFLNNIFESGTFGHHWKEFSIRELVEYFKILTPDFSINRLVTTSIKSVFEEQWRHRIHLKDSRPSFVDMEKLVAQLADDGAAPFNSQIYLDLELKDKSVGIQISPPWIP